MIGRIVVLSPAEYQDWLSARTATETAAAGPVRGEKVSLASQGEQVFVRNGCKTCHATSPAERTSASIGPPLYGLFGRSVPLENGYSVVAEEQYLRRSILEPMAETVSGYRPVMPTYTGRLTEEDVMKIVAFIKSLSAEYRPPEDFGGPGTGGEGSEAPGEAEGS